MEEKNELLRVDVIVHNEQLAKIVIIEEKDFISLDFTPVEVNERNIIKIQNLNLKFKENKYFDQDFFNNFNEIEIIGIEVYYSQEPFDTLILDGNEYLNFSSGETNSIQSSKLF